MKKYTILLLVAAASFAFVGCQDKAKSESAEATKAEEAAKPAPKETAAKKVEITADGTKFDPSVPVDDVPSEAWVCNMGGKTHYAALEKGDGRCPVCNMKLTQHGHDGSGHHHE